MGSRGPERKESHSRARDTARRTAPAFEVASDDVERGQDLPDSYEWPPQTRKWWQTWRESPQAQAFLDTDWDYLLDTALLHADFWLGDRSVAGELRQRLAKFGATPEDRSRMKLSVGDPVVSEAPRLTARQSGNRSGRLLKSAS
jgi:hypothetical protein